MDSALRQFAAGQKVDSVSGSRLLPMPMKQIFPRIGAKAQIVTLLLVSAGLLSAVGNAKAVVVNGGSVTLSFDEVEFFLVGLTNINSFDQATSNTLTAAQVAANAGTTTSWSGISYGVNPISPLINPTGRNLQETTFSYDETNLTGTAAGQIGIGGTSRWDVDPFLGGGVFVLGDYALTYSSGVWRLENNFSFASPAFYLDSPSLTSVSATGFTLSGNLRADTGLLLFGFSPTATYGTFTMVTTAIPEPSSVAMLILGGAAMVALRRARKSAVSGNG